MRAKKSQARRVSKGKIPAYDEVEIQKKYFGKTEVHIMNGFCGNDCLWLLLLLFCCGGNKCGGCNIESILWIYLILCCCGNGCGCGCKDAPNFGFGCK